MIKTAKISKVNNKKEWQGPKGTIIYHDLIMDNGDKINIGKKKDQIEGWDITYEITGDVGQQEYVKAKAAQPEGGFSRSFSGSSKNNKQITELACLKVAATISAAYIGQGHKVNTDDVIRLKNELVNDILRAEKPVESSRNILDNKDTLANGEVVIDDMPF
tara:strand:+ start:104 stop:586 length:483 start_codon:yes stop_codon:yes gene_type:complete